METAHSPAGTSHAGPNHPAEDQPGTMVDVMTLMTGAEVVGSAATEVTAFQSSQEAASVLSTGRTQMVSVMVDLRVIVSVGSGQSPQV